MLKMVVEAVVYYVLSDETVASVCLCLEYSSQNEANGENDEDRMRNSTLRCGKPPPT